VLVPGLAACGDKLDGVQIGAPGASGDVSLTSSFWCAPVRSFFDTYCTRCHSTTVLGSDRNGAPAAVNFNDCDGVLARRDRVVQVLGSGYMPPADPKPGDGDKDLVRQWADWVDQNMTAGCQGACDTGPGDADVAPTDPGGG